MELTNLVDMLNAAALNARKVGGLNNSINDIYSNMLVSDIDAVKKYTEEQMLTAEEMKEAPEVEAKVKSILAMLDCLIRFRDDLRTNFPQILDIDKDYKEWRAAQDALEGAVPATDEVQ